MQTLSLSCSSLYNNKQKQQQVRSIKTPTSHQSIPFCRVISPQPIHKQHLRSLTYNPLRVLSMNKKGHGFGAVCYSAPLTPRNLQWISTVCTAVLMLAKGTAIHKSFLVPLFVLQAPATIVSWMKGEYGIWTAFLALLVRLFFYIPGELELPFITLMLIIVSPYEIMRLRGKQEGVILSLIIVIYLGFQHFSRAGGLGKAFDQGSILATLATICIVAVPCLLLI
ncbi:hypothetical protein BUALT_Bualt03G0033200 [Buddleja alternifolia]|uniref:Uncharacterized protein n=1 Tax=Buddleja alternifolia TaxID=168488 RepID=A0AAV6XQT5_9LAMI|nr:hypothetical protein BUALT_Bualt03G0033200 [Buddleja alternifolia]